MKKGQTPIDFKEYLNKTKDQQETPKIKSVTN